MSFFRGLAGGLARGTTEFLASEDARMEADMKASMAEYKRRIEKQTDKRDARKKELIDSIGGFTSRGYSIETASQALEKFGSKGAARLLTQADAAKAAGTSYEDFIVEVAGPGSPTDPKTAQDLATELAYRELPTIESSALNAPRPFGGDTSILSNLIRGDGDPSTSPDQVDQMLKRFGASLPDQSREQTFTLPSDRPEGMEDLTEVDPTPQQSSFTVNRNLIPTDESRKLAAMNTRDKAEYDIANGTPEEVDAALETLRLLAEARVTDVVARLDTKIAKTKPGAERDALVKERRDIILSRKSDAQVAGENNEVIDQAIKSITMTMVPMFSKKSSTSKVKGGNLAVDPNMRDIEREVTKIQFTINGEDTRYLEPGKPEFAAAEERYIKGKNAYIEKFISKQPLALQQIFRDRLITSAPVVSEKELPTGKKGKGKEKPARDGALSEKEHTDRMESALVAFKEGTATIDKLVNGTEVVVLDDISIPVAELRAYEVEMQENFDDIGASNDLLAFNEKDADEEVEAIKDAISSTTGSASLLTKPADKQAREIEIAETQSTVLEKLRVKLNKRNYTEQEQQEIVNATTKYMRAARTGNPFQPGPARSYFKELESLLSTIKELMQKKRKP